MSIPTSCTHCGKEYDVGQAFVDKQVNCHTCHKSFQATTTAQHARVAAQPALDPLADLDEIPMSPAAPAPTKRKKGKAKPSGQRKLKIYDTEDGLYSEAPWSYILQCPGTWLVGICVLYCLMAMCLLTGPLRELEPFPVIIAGVIGFVGICVQGHFYFWRWTDIGELQKQSKEKIADDPPWIHRSMLAIVLLPMAGFLLWGKGWYKYDAEQVVAELTTPLPSTQQATPSTPAPTPAPSTPATAPGPVSPPATPAPVNPTVPSVNPSTPAVPPPTPTPVPLPVQPPNTIPSPANPANPPANSSDSIAQQLRVLKENDTFTSTKAAKNLAAMQPIPERRAEVLAALNAALEGDNSWVRSDALKALVVWKDDQTALKIAAVLAKSDDFSYRWELLDVLRELKDPRTAPAIAKQVAVSSDATKAVAALKAIGPAAEPSAIPLLQAKSFRVQILVCELLGEIGTTKSIAPLRSAEKNGNGIVQQYATQAIQAIQNRR